MAKVSHRVFAGFFAVLFLLSASALTIAIIWQAVASKGNNGSSTVSSQSTTKVLQGTKMQNFTPLTTPLTQLQTQDLKVGTGEEVKPGSTVTVDYTGAVASTGVVFQSSLDTGQPVTFNLSQVIKGWTEGIPGMKVGGTRRLLIPAALAYGANPPQGSGIPANADLVFDVTVHKTN